MKAALSSSLLALAGGLLACGPKPSADAGTPDGGRGPGPITCTAPAEACGTVCVDVKTSIAHCGACDSPCLVGYTCTNGACEFALANPYLSAVTPGSVNSGGLVTMQLTGLRFASGATVLLSGSGAPPDAGVDGERALTVHTASTASIDNLDLTLVRASTVTVRVLNPGRVASNTQAFVILSGDGGMGLLPPVITAINPNQAPSAATSAVSISGSNFQPSCTARLSGGGLASPKDFTAVELGSNNLYVGQLDLNGVPPGSYSMSVLTTAGQSNLLPFTVLTPPPSLTTISPTHAQKGTQVVLMITGNNFDPTSILMIQDPVGAITPIPTSFVSATQISSNGPLDLTNYAVGNYGVFVQNGGSVNSINTLGFVVDSNDPTLVSAVPGSGRQDQTMGAGAVPAVVLNGAGFQAGAKVTLSSPTGAINPQQLATASVVPTKITLANWALMALPIGTYSLQVANPGSNPSGKVTFVVLQGAPIISSISPTSAATNTVVNGSVSGQYFYPSSVVYVDGGPGSYSPLPTTFDAGVLYVTSDLTGVPPAVYQITVVNPGPLTSNPVNFTVTP